MKTERPDENSGAAAFPADSCAGRSRPGLPCRRSAAGAASFTLIEAVLAVAIMSVCAFALLTATSRCLAVAVQSRNLHAAATVLDHGELEYPLKPTNEVSENVVEPVTYLDKYTFERTVEPFMEEEDVFVIKTRISWSAKGKKASETVETLLYSTNHP